MKKLLLVLLAVLALSPLTYCQSGEKVLSELKGPYLGQKPPGITPEIFAPGIVSSKEYVESNCIVWDDGKNILFYRINKGKLEAQMTENGWSPLNNSIEWDGPTLLHYITPDGKKMFYNYFEPAPPGSKSTTTRLLVKQRVNGKWSEGVDTGLNIMWATTDANGSLYYTTRTNGLASIVKINSGTGVYTEKEVMPYINEVKMRLLHPCVARDGSYMIMDCEQSSHESGCDLYVSFKNKEGKWTDPQSMGDIIPLKDAAMARLSSDGKYIFFQAEGDIYWVSAKIIEVLKPKE